MNSPLVLARQLMSAISLLCLTLTAQAQTSDEVSNSSTTAVSSPADWTQFHRDNMQRWNPYETVIGVNNAGSLQLKWKNAIGEYINAIESSPAVVNGIAYFGSDEGKVVAMKASTGEILWSSDIGFISGSSPAVVNGVVYIGSFDHNVYALNASSGAKLWSSSTGGFVQSPPTVVNGIVYIGSGDHHLYALSASTGTKLWSYATGNAVYSAPAVANGVVYVGSEDGHLYALNASTGVKLWSYDTGGIFVDSSPAVTNGVVYIGAYYAVYALNATTGAKLWAFPTGAQVNSAPAVANGVVYFGSFDHDVYAVNANTGAKLWSYNTGQLVDSSPAVANGVAYITNTDGSILDLGSLFALNANTGAKLWSYYIHGANSSPTVVDGTVYVRGGNHNNQSRAGNIYAFSLGSTNDADLFLRINPSATTVHQGDLLTYAFPVWNLGPSNADFEVLNTQVPAGTTFDYIRISGTPGLGTCTTPPYQGTGQIVCHENAAMAPNTTWTVRLTVKVTAPAGTVITANAATMADTPDPNMANNTATVSVTVQ